MAVEEERPDSRVSANSALSKAATFTVVEEEKSKIARDRLYAKMKATVEGDGKTVIKELHLHLILFGTSLELIFALFVNR